MILNIKKRKTKQNNMLRSRPVKVFFAFVFIIFMAYAISLIYPFVWMINNSLKTNLSFAKDSMALTTEWKLSNFFEAFAALKIRKTNMFGMLFNSIWFAGGATLISMFFSSCTAYVITKYKFPGRGYLYSLAIVLMMLPIAGSLPAQYKIISSLGIKDSPLLLLMYTGGFGFNFIIMYAAFKSLSWDYAEAAFIDGASHTKVYLKIMLPMVMPSFVALSIVQGITFWNDFQTPLLYLRNFPTLASGLYEFDPKTIVGGSYPIYFAGLFLSMVPVLVLFGIFQNTIMQNTVAGGLKG